MVESIKITNSEIPLRSFSFLTMTKTLQMLCLKKPTFNVRSTNDYFTAMNTVILLEVNMKKLGEEPQTCISL